MNKPIQIIALLASSWSWNTALASPEADDVLALAVDTGNWLASQAIPQDAGVAWPADALQSKDASLNLGSGTAGVVVYLLGLHRATGEDRFLQLAEAGADYLVSLVRRPGLLQTGSRRASLYTGLAGIGVALSRLAEVNADYSAPANEVVLLLDDWSIAEGSGLRWSDEFNDLLYGDAGTVLFLADYAWRTRDTRAQELAVAGARRLAARGRTATAGRYWLFRRSKDFNLPGFSHGTSGIAYVLATVGELASDEILRQAASDGFDYIRSIAEVDGDIIRIPYGWPAENWKGLYEFGWAHGLAGTKALLARLQQLGIQEPEAARLDALIVNTLSNIELPGPPAVPFAEPSTPLDWRFGRASVLSILSDSSDSIKTRDATWEAIAEAAIRDSDTAYWLVDAPEFMGGGEAAFTGVLHGSAGIGLALLRLHASLVGARPYITLPDDPMAWISRTSSAGKP